MAYSRTRKTKFKNEEEIKGKVLELYKGELNNVELAKAVGCSRTKMGYILLSMGIGRPKRHSYLVGVPEARIAAMLADYVNHPERPLDEIARYYEVSIKTLCKYVNERGIPRRKKYKMVGNKNAKGAPKGRSMPDRPWMSWGMRTYGE